jgi:dihydrolipoamide dehydrogenase
VSQPVEVRVPDIGDFADVPIIEIHVALGQAVAPEDPLVTLESDKATMDVPSPLAGTVEQLRVAVGDHVSEGSVLLTIQPQEAATAGAAPPAAGAPPTAPPPAAGQLPSSPGGAHPEADVVVVGAGPGGYTAAFRAADLGLRTILVERHSALGGVCLNVGCIPSKALLHAARVIAQTQEMAEHGVSFGEPTVDLQRLIGWKQSVVDRLTGGLAGLARARKVEVVRGEARFTGAHSLAVGEREITFAHAIIAVGSRPATLPFLPEDERIIDSTAALSPTSIPKRMLVVGGGIIGLEMAAVYDALGSRVTVVELLDQLIPGADSDLVQVLHRRVEGRYERISLGVSVTEARAQRNGIRVQFSDASTGVYDRVLVAVGRRANGALVGAQAAGVQVDESGLIEVDAQRRTNVSHIFAIGDVTGEPMLAHKASHEARVAAEAIAGLPGVAFDPRAIPSVAYTDPEIAWAGLTEAAARERGIAFERASFPWSASGRALSLARADGLTKLLYEPESRRLLGAGIVGVGAGELIAEAVHALEQGADVEDLALTIHPHPTLSETVGFAAELAQGTITDLLPPRSRR